MVNTSVDKRTVRTKLLLSDALLGLLADKKVGEITTHELCQNAGVNRGTFYKYYKNVPDMLQTIENELFNQYDGLFAEAKASFNPSIFIYEALKIAQKNKGSCLLLLDAESYGFIQRVTTVMHDATIEYWQKTFNFNDTQTLERAFTFISTGFIGTVDDWVRHDFDISPAELASIINQMGDSCVEAFTRE